MKKVLSIVAALAMACALGACSSPSGSSDASASASSASAEASSSVSASASESSSSASPADEAAQLLKGVSGTYDELFTVICAPEYDQIWLDDCKAIVGDEKAAQQAAEALKGACTGTLYGEEAVKAFASNPESTCFDCSFINGVHQITFDGNKISGTDAAGNKMFEHEYKFAKEASIGGKMNGYLYETADADAGEFKYFFLLPDTPATTYHIEFRYGSDADALAQYDKGAYAYWLAAGISADRDKKMVEDVIGLFVEENLSAEAK